MANVKLNKERVRAAYNRLVDKGEFRGECCDMLGELMESGFKCAAKDIAEINAMCDAILAE